MNHSSSASQAPRQTPRHILVTGGTGFIGTHLCRRLLAQGDHVTIVDDFSTGSPDNVELLRTEFALPDNAAPLTLIESDVRDSLPALRSTCFDEVYHLAATVGVQLIMKDPIKAAETNTEATTAVLRFGVDAKRRHGRSPSILIASSSEVYGKSTRLPFSEEDDTVYGTTTMTRWSYAQCKALNEYMGLAYHRQHDLPVVVARFFNTVGPGQIGEYGMVLPRFVKAALEGRPLIVHGDGRQMRCFGDARDVTRAIVTLMGAGSENASKSAGLPSCFGRVFNVGSDRPISIADLADLVIRLTNSTSIKQFTPYTQAFGPGFEDIRDRRPDLTRIREAINYAPTRTLDDTILDIAASLRAKAAPIVEVKPMLAVA